MKLGEEVSAGELAEAWRGFCRWQRRKGFSWHFIWSDGVDMFAQAQLELSQALARGIEIYSPPGCWLPALYSGQRIFWRNGREPLR